MPDVPVSFCIIGGVTITSMTDRSGMATATVPRGVNANAVIYGRGSAEPVVKRLLNGEATLTMPVPLEAVRIYVHTATDDGINVALLVRDRQGTAVCEFSVSVFDGAPVNVNLAPGTYSAVLEWGGQRREMQIDVTAGTATSVHTDLQ